MPIETRSNKKEATITLTFEWDGVTVQKDLEGFEGKSCKEKTAFVEQALGAYDEKTTFKPEYLRPESPQANQGLTA